MSLRDAIVHNLHAYTDDPMMECADCKRLRRWQYVVIVCCAVIAVSMLGCGGVDAEPVEPIAGPEFRCTSMRGVDDNGWWVYIDRCELPDGTVCYLTSGGKLSCIPRPTR